MPVIKKINWLWSIANNPIYVQIEKWIHSVLKQYLKIFSLFFARTVQAYVEIFTVNNGISSIRVY